MSAFILSLSKQMYKYYLSNLLLCNYQSNYDQPISSLNVRLNILYFFPHAGPVFELLAFFSVTLKWRDFVYPRLCLFNILLSGGVSQSLSSTQSPQTASKHSSVSNRTILNFPSSAVLSETMAERNIIMDYD